MSSFPVTLVFADGEAVRVDCRPFETVVQAAARHNVRILVDCREGGCGTCKATIQCGQFSLDDYSGDALTAAELEEGRILSCRMWPESACVVEFDYPMAAIRRGAPVAARPVTLVELARRADDVIEVTVELQDGKPFNFLPGQYANLQNPGTGIVRSYSFVNQPGSAQAIFLVRLLRDGAMSGWLQRQAAPGAQLLITGPFGRFFLRDPGQPLVFVAGGTGLGPIVSMLESLRTAGTIPPALKLVFGVNTLGGLFYRERLESLVADFPDSELIISVMSPESDWAGATGTVVDALAPAAIDPASHAYLCGPPIMVERTRALLQSRGVGERLIFAEAFLPTSESKAA